MNVDTDVGAGGAPPAGPGPTGAKGGGEVHLFVLWEHARVAEKRILDDLKARFDVLAAVPASWPESISAATAFKRFYGTFLADPAGKAARAGGGEFLVVVVRDRNPRYELVETVRGLERVDVNVFELKYVYRGWVGGQHRVHGTNSPEEARRDVLLLTGHPLGAWVDGSAAGKPMTVLPGQNGWRSLSEMFAFLGETIPYAVLRNGEALPEGFDPLHDDIDMLVANVDDCVGLLGARKAPSGGALHVVEVGGRDVKLDLRSVGDGYFDEGWERRMLSSRVVNAHGVYVLSPENHFHALVYHALYQKRAIARDYPRKARAAAAAIGVAGDGFDAWAMALEAFMARNGYRFARPRDRTVSLCEELVSWHVNAIEAAELFGLESVRLADLAERAVRRKHLTDLLLRATWKGRACRIEYGRRAKGLGEGEYRAAADFRRAAPGLAIEPLAWHVGRSGAYMAWGHEEGCSLQVRLEHGPAISEEEAGRLAADALACADALERAGLVHRDICPANLFLARGGGLKLIGFRFAVRRSSYAKEAASLRKDPLGLLAPLGGAFAPSPGRWDDAWSLARCLDLLPQTPAVAAAKAELEQKAAGGARALRVRLPARTRLRMLMAWARFAVADLFRPHGRSAAKHRARRLFARTAFLGPAGARLDGRRAAF